MFLLIFKYPKLFWKRMYVEYIHIWSTERAFSRGRWINGIIKNIVEMWLVICHMSIKTLFPSCFILWNWNHYNKSILLDTFTVKQTSDNCWSSCLCVLLQGGHLPPALLFELAAGGLDSGSIRQSRPPHCLLGPQVSYSRVEVYYHPRTTDQWSVQIHQNKYMNNKLALRCCSRQDFYLKIHVIRLSSSPYWDP